MMKRSYRKAYKLLKENESVLDALAEYLIEKETITGKEFMKIYHEITGDVLKEATEEGADSISEESVVLGNGIDATV
jgi:cell division protease FtsH